MVQNPELQLVIGSGQSAEVLQLLRQTAGEPAAVLQAWPQRHGPAAVHSTNSVE
jgi:hypothetical protein